MNYQHIMNLAIKRRATLIKRLRQAQDKSDDCKCDQIMFRLQYENEIIGNCKQELQRIEDSKWFSRQEAAQ